MEAACAAGAFGRLAGVKTAAPGVSAGGSTVADDAEDCARRPLTPISGRAPTGRRQSGCSRNDGSENHVVVTGRIRIGREEAPSHWRHTEQ
jgi:hypothetical protein